MTKKPKTVWVDNIEVTPVTAKERRALDKKVKKRHERLRKRYKEIRGKRVDWISHNYEEGLLCVGIRFTYGTYFSLQFAPSIVTEGIDFSDLSSGDDEIIKTYYRRPWTDSLVAVCASNHVPVDGEEAQEKASERDEREFDSGDEPHVAPPDSNSGSGRPETEEQSRAGKNVLDDEVLVERACGSKG